MTVVRSLVNMEVWTCYVIRMIFVRRWPDVIVAVVRQVLIARRGREVMSVIVSTRSSDIVVTVIRPVFVARCWWVVVGVVWT